MRYYKFNRDRSLNPLQKRIRSCKKLSYNAKRNNLHMLDSFHFENQTWGALCTSIAVDDDGDDILDTLFINGIDENGVFIFNDLFLLLTLL